MHNKAPWNPWTGMHHNPFLAQITKIFTTCFGFTLNLKLTFLFRSHLMMYLPKPFTSIQMFVLSWLLCAVPVKKLRYPLYVPGKNRTIVLTNTLISKWRPKPRNFKQAKFLLSYSNIAWLLALFAHDNAREKTTWAVLTLRYLPDCDYLLFLFKSRQEEQMRDISYPWKRLPQPIIQPNVLLGKIVVSATDDERLGLRHGLLKICHVTRRIATVRRTVMSGQL